MAAGRFLRGTRGVSHSPCGRRLHAGKLSGLALHSEESACCRDVARMRGWAFARIRGGNDATRSCGNISGSRAGGSDPLRFSKLGHSLDPEPRRDVGRYRLTCTAHARGSFYVPPLGANIPSRNYGQHFHSFDTTRSLLSRRTQRRRQLHSAELPRRFQGPSQQPIFSSTEISVD